MSYNEACEDCGSENIVAVCPDCDAPVCAMHWAVDEKRCTECSSEDTGWDNEADSGLWDDPEDEDEDEDE